MIDVFLYITETGKKTLKLGALTTDNSPQRTVESTSKLPAERRHINKVVPEDAKDKTDIVYKRFTDFVKKVQKMKLHGWEIMFDNTRMVLKHFLKPCLLPKYELITFVLCYRP